MISIKQYNTKWRLEIKDETWQFEDLEQLRDIISTLLDIKNKYGRIKNE